MPGGGFVATCHDVTARVRAAGGLYIADEVQSGFGRTGDELWRRLLALHGFGPYAAGQAMRLCGHYDRLALDSWCRARLAEKSAPQIGIGSELRREHLHRDAPLERLVPAGVHDAHAAAPELRLDAEPGERLRHRTIGGHPRPR